MSVKPTLTPSMAIPSNVDIDATLRRIFVQYASFGNISNVNSLGSAKFYKLTRDAGLLGATLTTVDMDMIFVRAAQTLPGGKPARGGGGLSANSKKALSYPQFLEAVAEMAATRAGVSSSRARTRPTGSSELLALLIEHLQPLTSCGPAGTGAGGQPVSTPTDRADGGAIGEEELLARASLLEAIFMHYSSTVRVADECSFNDATGFWEEIQLERGALAAAGIAAADDPLESVARGGTQAMEISDWQRFASHFGVCPMLLSKAELGKLFQHEAARAPPASRLTFPQFAHALGATAAAAFPPPRGRPFPDGGARSVRELFVTMKVDSVKVVQQRVALTGRPLGGIVEAVFRDRGRPPIPPPPMPLPLLPPTSGLPTATTPGPRGERVGAIGSVEEGEEGGEWPEFADGIDALRPPPPRFDEGLDDGRVGGVARQEVQEVSMLEAGRRVEAVVAHAVEAVEAVAVAMAAKTSLSPPAAALPPRPSLADRKAAPPLASPPPPASVPEGDDALVRSSPRRSLPAVDPPTSLSPAPHAAHLGFHATTPQPAALPTTAASAAPQWEPTAPSAALEKGAPSPAPLPPSSLMGPPPPRPPLAAAMRAGGGGSCFASGSSASMCGGACSRVSQDFGDFGDFGEGRGSTAASARVEEATSHSPPTATSTAAIGTAARPSTSPTSSPIPASSPPAAADYADEVSTHPLVRTSAFCSPPPYLGGEGRMVVISPTAQVDIASAAAAASAAASAAMASAEVAAAAASVVAEGRQSMEHVRREEKKLAEAESRRRMEARQRAKREATEEEAALAGAERRLDAARQAASAASAEEAAERRREREAEARRLEATRRRQETEAETAEIEAQAAAARRARAEQAAAQAEAEAACELELSLTKRRAADARLTQEREVERAKMSEEAAKEAAKAAEAAAAAREAEEEAAAEAEEKAAVAMASARKARTRQHAEEAAAAEAESLAAEAASAAGAAEAAAAAAIAEGERRRAVLIEAEQTRAAALVAEDLAKRQRAAAEESASRQRELAMLTRQRTQLEAKQDEQRQSRRAKLARAADVVAQQRAERETMVSVSLAIEQHDSAAAAEATRLDELRAQLQQAAAQNKRQLAATLRGVQLLRGPEGPDPKLLAMSQLHMLGEVGALACCVRCLRAAWLVARLVAACVCALGLICPRRSYRTYAYAPMHAHVCARARARPTLTPYPTPSTCRYWTGARRSLRALAFSGRRGRRAGKCAL